MPYATDSHYRSEDMMVLCPNCHAMATRGSLTEKDQRKYKRNPRNIKRRYSAGLLAVDQDYCAISFGSVQFVGDGPFIVVDGESLISLRLGDEDQLEFSVSIYDSGDEQLLLIKNNEWQTGDPGPWDFEFKYNYLKLRRKKRDIGLEIDAREKPLVVRADVWKNKQNISLGPTDVLINGVIKNSGMNHLCLVGLRIEIDTGRETTSIAPDPRYGGGMFVSEADIAERLRKGREAWLRLQERAG